LAAAAGSAPCSSSNGLSQQKRICAYKGRTKAKDRESGRHKRPFLKLVLALFPSEKQTNERDNPRGDNLKPGKPSQVSLCGTTKTHYAVAQDVEQPCSLQVREDDDYARNYLHAEQYVWPEVGRETMKWAEVTFFMRKD
jgi:hypothetical protein